MKNPKFNCSLYLKFTGNHCKHLCLTIAVEYLDNGTPYILMIIMINAE